MPRGGALLIVALTLSVLECTAREWYVAPDGTAGGDGAKERPWSLEAALKPHPMIAPMDTVWVRKGVYNGAFVGRLKGAPGKPVVLRAYPGERVVLDGRDIPQRAVLRIEGEWAWYWGLEITNSHAVRDLDVPEMKGIPNRGTGIEMFGTDIKVINCVVHDTGVGVGMAGSARDQELYGVILFNNGWRKGEIRSGHSIYAQNEKGAKILRDVLLLNPYYFNMHIYGSKRAFLNNFLLEGNVGFNGRWLVGGEGPMKNITLRENLLYARTVELRYRNRRNENLVLEGNYLAGVTSALGWDRVEARGNTFVRPGQRGELLELSFWKPDGLAASIFEGNTYYVADERQQVARVGRVDGPEVTDYPFAKWRSELGFEKRGRLEVAQNGTPAEPKVFVRRNAYEPNRAHVVIYNWPKQDVVEVDISAMNPQPGDRWMLRNVQNYFEEFVSGVYDGKPLRVRMTGWTAAAPVGEDKPLYPVTFPEFGVFVLTLEKDGAKKSALNGRAGGSRASEHRDAEGGRRGKGLVQQCSERLHPALPWREAITCRAGAGKRERCKHGQVRRKALAGQDEYENSADLWIES